MKRLAYILPGLLAAAALLAAPPRALRAEPAPSAGNPQTSHEPSAAAGETGRDALAPTRAQHPTFSEHFQPLGRPDPHRGIQRGSFKLSDDSGHIAWIDHSTVHEEDRIFLDGEIVYSGPAAFGIALRPEGGKPCRVVRHLNIWFMINKRGVQGKKPVAGPFVAPAGARTAYMAEVDGGMLIFETHGKHERWTMLDTGRLGFSADGAILAYPAAYRRSRWYMVVNGEAGPAVNAIIQGPLFAPVGNRMAYIARTGRNLSVVSYKRRLGEFQQVQDLTFSPDGQRLVYWATIDGRQFGPGIHWKLYEEGNENEAFRCHKPGQLLFSPDSAHLAAAVKIKDGWWVMRDGKPGQRWQAIGKGSLQFSADSKRLAYAGWRDAAWHVVVDDHVIGSTPGLLSGSIRLSADGQRVAWAEADEAGMRVVVDGQAGPTFDKVHPASMTFGPGDGPIAYIAQRGGQTHLVAGDTIRGSYDAVLALRYSPAGDRLVWAARDAGEARLYVDGQPTEATFRDLTDGAKLHFLSDTRFQTMLERGDGPTFVRATIDLKP